LLTNNDYTQTDRTESIMSHCCTPGSWQWVIEAKVDGMCTAETWLRWLTLSQWWITSMLLLSHTNDTRAAVCLVSTKLRWLFYSYFSCSQM